MIIPGEFHVLQKINSYKHMKKLSLIILLLSNTLVLKAEDIFFQQYGINEGLSSNLVFGIAEDENGLLWIATTEGVDKFDGLNFKHYSLPQLTINGVVDYMELHIKSDSKGQIWLATRTGLIYKYDILKDEFQQVYQFKHKANLPSLIRLKAFYIDRKDNILISMNDGVWQIDNFTLQVQQVSENSGVQSIIQDEDNNYYWGNNKGIQVLDTTFQEINNVYPDGEIKLSNQKISRLYIDEITQTLWGVSEKEGVFYINMKNSSCTFPEALAPYKNLAIRAINRFSDDEIVIGVDGVGLVIWNVKTRSVIEEINYEDGKKGTLSSNAIFHIYRNDDGIFFISTHRGGINVYNPNKLNFAYMNSTPNNNNSLTNNYILSLKEISPGVIGFGTYEGISIWDKNRDQWQHLCDEDKKVSEVILSLAVDKEQNIWATSFTNSLMFFEYNNGNYRNSLSLKEPQKLKSKTLYIDNLNRIWISNHDGIYLYFKEENRMEHFPLNGLLTLMNLSENLLVLGTENGLSFFDTKTFKLHKFDFIDEAKIDMRLINCLTLDKQKRLWVGTKIDGLFVVDFYDKTIKNISIADGLPVNHIFGIAPGSRDIWLSTLKGISKIDKDFNVVNYTTSDGIASIDFNYDAALCDTDGMLYFGTNDGVVTLSPKDLTPDTPHKNIIFSEFRLNHKRIFPGKDSPLTSETNNVRRIKLKHFQNSFSPGFECVDFIQPERGFYHWKLENFDDDWMVSDKLSNINYNNLNPGDYTFKIKVVDEKGALISNEKTISITISKPWRLTQWAFILYAVMLLLLLWAASYFYRLKINSRSSSERLGFLINLAHEIKTPLILIKAPLNDLMSNEDITGVVRKNVNIALSSAERLHRQMIQFLDMGNLSRIENTLTLEHTDLVQFIHDKITAFNVLAEKKGITLSFNYNVTDFCIKMDKEVLDKILSNLVSNAIKYTNEGGTVIVNQQVKDKVCKISITDSGIGILMSEQKNIFKPFYRTARAKQTGSTGNGMGLVLASNLAKMLKGRISLLESTERGSAFEFSFPYERSDNDELIVEANEDQPNKAEHRTKLLLVEDDEDLLNYSMSKLQDHYEVIIARNGIEALEKCKQTLPNLIISDVLMPQMNGLQLCMKLKADVSTSHIPIILFTGLDSKEEILEGLEAGADDYIVKPFEFDILIKKAETLLNNRIILQKKFLFQTDENEDVGFASELDDEWISKVNKFVEAHIEDPDLSPAILYKKFGMSRSAFYHKTKSLVDLSPIELIRTIRLKKAKSMLGKSEYEISEIAYQLGFNDPKYFSTLFKRYFGQTPTSFINQKKTLRES